MLRKLSKARRKNCRFLVVCMLKKKVKTPIIRATKLWISGMNLCAIIFLSFLLHQFSVLFSRPLSPGNWQCWKGNPTCGQLWAELAIHSYLCQDLPQIFSLLVNYTNLCGCWGQPWSWYDLKTCGRKLNCIAQLRIQDFPAQVNPYIVKCLFTKTTMFNPSNKRAYSFIAKM